MTGFRYILVDWRHEHASEPIRLFSEVDSAGWETRKVEVFRDGRMCFADSTAHTGTTRIGEEVIPSIAEIARDSQFAPREIAKEEFERVWLQAKAS